MESMQRKDGKGFVSTYIVPNNGTRKGAKMMGKKKSLIISDFPLISVIRLGLEPKTPTLKVLCSTD